MWAGATRAGRTTVSIPASFAAERTRAAATSSVPQTSTLRPAQRKVRSHSRESGTCSRSASNRTCSGSRDRFASTSTSKSLMLSSFRSYTRGQKTCRELFRRSSVSNCRQRRAETSGSKGSSQQARGCVRLWGLDGARARPSQQCYSGSASDREHHPNCASGRERFCPAAVVGAHERDRQSCGDGRVAERQRDVPDLEIFPHHRPELRGGGPRGGGRAEPDDIAAVEQHRLGSKFRPSTLTRFPRCSILRSVFQNGDAQDGTLPSRVCSESLLAATWLTTCSRSRRHGVSHSTVRPADDLLHYLPQHPVALSHGAQRQDQRADRRHPRARRTAVLGRALRLRQALTNGFSMRTPS